MGDLTAPFQAGDGPFQGLDGSFDGGGGRQEQRWLARCVPLGQYGHCRDHRGMADSRSKSATCARRQAAGRSWATVFSAPRDSGGTADFTEASQPQREYL